MFSFFSRRSGEHSRNASTDGNSAAQQQSGDNTRFPSASPHPFGPEDSPSPAPEAEQEQEPEAEDQVEVTDPAPLCALISSVPPQTLHAYTLLHLSPPPPTPYPVFTSTPALLGQPKPLTSSPPSPRTLTALTRFFSSLRPPPELHCVRCHKDYFEVDNGDSSCRVPHDDESADVEFVGNGPGRCSDYDTYYRCCDKTVEGEGDMGPPDGWCYEGRHTTDLKRARFRKDAYPGDDKLVSCASLRCHEPSVPTLRTSRARGSAMRKRKRQTMEVDQDENPDEEGGSVTSSRRGGHARTHSKSASIASTGNITTASTTVNVNANNKGKGRASVRPEGAQEEEEETEADEDGTQVEKKRPTKRPRSRKPSTLIRLQQDSNGDVFMQDADTGASPGTPETSAPASTSVSARKTTTAKKRSSKSLTTTKATKSPLSSSFTPAAATASRASSTSPTRKGKSAVEVSIPLSRKGSLALLNKKQANNGVVGDPHQSDDREGRPAEKGKQASRAKPGPKPKPRAVKKVQAVATKGLGEVVDTSVDAEQWN